MARTSRKLAAVVLMQRNKPCRGIDPRGHVLAISWLQEPHEKSTGGASGTRAFGGEHRTYVLQHLRGHFPVREQWLIVPPWLGGIVLGGLLSHLRRLLRRR